MRPLVAVFALIVVSIGIAGCTGSDQSLIDPRSSSTTEVAGRVPTSSPGEPAMVFMISEEGGFQAWLPVSGNLVERSSTKTLLGHPVGCSILVSRLNGALAIIEYCDIVAQSLEGLSSSVVLDRVYPELLANMGVRLEVVEPLSVSETYDALHLQGPQNMRGVSLDGEFQGRVILAENRIYFIAMSVHEDNWCECRHQVDRFLDSFFIDTDHQIPSEASWDEGQSERRLTTR